MIKGIYTAASGMMLDMTRQDILANNLANANTNGYKKDRVASSAFPDMLMNRVESPSADGSTSQSSTNPIGLLGSGACLGTLTTDFSQGSLKETENPLDLAISNGSYFVVETQAGERFTRNGEFAINSDGVLTDLQGNPVMDDNDDQITINGKFTIDSHGSIAVNGETTNNLKIVKFDNTQSLQKEGNNLLTSQDQYTIDDNPQIKQGYLEQSNVSPVQEMVDMIKVVRSYESLQKVIQAEDDTLQTAIEKVGSAK